MSDHRISSLSLSEFPVFVSALYKVKKAAALANSEAGDISAVAGHQITAACDYFLNQTDPSPIQVDPYSGGGGILVHSWLNQALAAKSGTDAKAEVNCSQSTADVLATAFRIALFGLIEPLLQQMQSSIELLQLNQNKFKATPSMARTCLQDALPVPLGTLFEGPMELLKRRRLRLTEIQQTFLKVSLGGTVIGSGEGASASYRSKVIQKLGQVTGLPVVSRDSLFDAAQNCDDLSELNQVLTLLAEGLIKINKDLRLLASGPKHGFGDLRLPKVISGSTFFKDKNNPTIPETLIQACFLVLGKSRTAGAASEHAELNLNVFEPVIGFSVYESILILTKALQLWNTHCLNDITAEGKNV